MKNYDKKLAWSNINLTYDFCNDFSETIEKVK